MFAELVPSISSNAQLTLSAAVTSFRELRNLHLYDPQNLCSTSEQMMPERGGFAATTNQGKR